MLLILLFIYVDFMVNPLHQDSGVTNLHKNQWPLLPKGGYSYLSQKGQS